MTTGRSKTGCHLVDCKPVEQVTLGEIEQTQYQPDDKSQLYGWTQRQMGDYSPGRFAWYFEDLKALPVPFPFKGGQGFFNVPDELIMPNVPASAQHSESTAAAD